jgi:hypothetical protein
MTDTRRRCARDGCGRSARPPYTFCSTLCSVVDAEMEQAKRLCEFTSDRGHWLRAVEIGEAVNAYRRSDRQIYQAARDVGITAEQWRSIKFGATSHDQTG